MINIKEKLIERIRANEDTELLKEIYNLLESEQQDEIHFSEEQINTIRESEAQYEKGEVIPNEEVQKKLDEWLEK